MRHGSGTAHLDLSDVEPPIDTIDAILTVAGEVLADYGADPGATRIERMARWIALNFGYHDVGVETEHVGLLTHYALDHASVWRVGSAVGMTTEVSTRAQRLNPKPLSLDEARAVSAALVRAVEEAEARED